MSDESKVKRAVKNWFARRGEIAAMHQRHADERWALEMRQMDEEMRRGRHV